MPDTGFKLNDAEILDRFCGSPEVVVEMVDLFRSLLPGRMECIRSALGAGDAGALASCCHELKGAVSSFGESPVKDRCSQLEQLAKAGELVRAKEAFDRLQETVEVFVAALKALRDRQ
jgi:HPt (histidine-containing phosphotransfer) domain-containing protein